MPGLDPSIHRPGEEMSVYYVYIMASGKNGTIYVGSTSDLIRRAYEHRRGLVEGFTKRYGVTRLVYFEETQNARAAVQRERTIKHWRRTWKIALIEKTNPTWRDLYEDIIR